MAEAQAIRMALPRKLGMVIGRNPRVVFSRTIQVLLDASMTVLAVFSAYMLRFDGDLSQAAKSHMLFWVLLLPVLRPIALLVCNGYDSTWRFFQLRDAVRVVSLAIPVSIVVAGG